MRSRAQPDFEGLPRRQALRQRPGHQSEYPAATTVAATVAMGTPAWRSCTAPGRTDVRDANHSATRTTAANVTRWRHRRVIAITNAAPARSKRTNQADPKVRNHPATSSNQAVRRSTSQSAKSVSRPNHHSEEPPRPQPWPTARPESKASQSTTTQIDEAFDAEPPAPLPVVCACRRP